MALFWMFCGGMALVTLTPRWVVQALADLLKVQTEDFLAMFKTMSGRDVVVRLLDPPLHEFLDNPRELEVAITKKEAAGASEEELAVLRARLRRIDGMVESNPMLGLRGVRLSVVFSDLPLMQVRAVATAAARLIKEGVDPRPEIMVPLVSITAEHVQTREVIERGAAQLGWDLEKLLTMTLQAMAATEDEIKAEMDAE